MNATSDRPDDADMSHAEKIAWIVQEHGWAAEPVPPVDGDPPRPGYTYTIGFETTYARPEVVIFGLTPVAARGLLQLVADQYAAGLELPVGAVFVGLLDNDLPCALLAVDLSAHPGLAPAAAAHHGDAGFRLVQLVWPDRAGRLPWDESYDRRLRFAQPVVGSW